MRLVLIAALALSALAAPATAAVRVEGTRFVDGKDRQVVLRGGALIAKFGSGLPAVSERDWEQMRALGWNSIRLGTAWEFVEPARGDYDEAYLDALAAIAREATAHGLGVIVDFHQDVWGAPAGNGAPAWATYPECEGTHVDLASAAGTFAANYFSPFTLCQFTRFWEDPALQDRYAAALARVVTSLGRDVVGYDLMNEPFQGAQPPAAFELRALAAFYARVTGALRAADPGAIVFAEPPNARNVHLPSSSAAMTLPAASAYAPHVYGLWDMHDAFTERAPLVAANMEQSRVDAELLGVPLWYGEFGMRRSAPGAEATLAQIYDLADAHLAGASVWEYARNDYGLLRADGSLDPARAATVARPYPARTAGSLTRFSYDGTFELEWRSSGRRDRTVVVVPGLAFPRGYAIDAGAGVTVRRTRGGERLVVRAPAGARRLVVRPA